MVEATGQLNIDERDNCDYSANVAGLTFIRQIREQCDALLEKGEEKRCSNNPRPFKPLTSPARFQSMSGSNPYHGLPHKNLAAEYVIAAFAYPLCLLRFIHEPSFFVRFEQFYSERKDTTSTSSLKDIRFEALLNELLALGTMFSVKSRAETAINTSATAEYFFQRGLELIDITDCRDLTSLQTLMCMVIYLQCCGDISTCHTYISLATAACTKMGLHRSESSRQLNPIDQEVRKRLFWTLRTTEIYVTTILGLPQTLSDDDVDQELPREVDDDYITKDGIKECICNATCPMTAVIAYTKLIQIMARIKRNVFNSRNPAADQSTVYMVDYGKVVDAQNELETWFARLPGDSSFSEPVSSSLIQSQLLLRLMYAHAQMMLYRPFLHHITKRKTDHDFDLRAFACASACVQAAKQVVLSDEALDSKGLLRGSFWCIFYPTFVSVICLVIFALSNKVDPAAQESLSVAIRGYHIFLKFAKLSSSANNFAESLRPLFDRLTAEGLCDISALDVQEDLGSHELDALPSTLFEPVTAPSNKLDTYNPPMELLPTTSESMTRYAAPDAEYFEPHMQALYYPPNETLHYLRGLDGLGGGLTPFGNQNTFPDLSGDLFG